MERCWPDGPVTWDASGQARCSDKAIDPSEGRKSFPSGETPLAIVLLWEHLEGQI